MTRQSIGGLLAKWYPALPGAYRFSSGPDGVAGIRPQLLRLVVLALTYFVLARVGLSLASLHPSASPIWPPSGLALAATLLWGNRMWPGIAVGAFLANLLTHGSVVTSLAIAAGNSAEALLTAALLQRWSNGSNTFETPFRIAVFACFALAPGTMVSATAGVGSVVLAGFADSSSFWQVWLTWWLGDVGGQLLVTPVVVLWAKSGWKANARDLQQLSMLLGATAIVGIAAFSPVIEAPSVRGPLAFLAIGPLLWAALRHDQRATATVALILCIFSVWGAAADRGPFARLDVNESFLLALAFVISTAVPSLILSADVAIRRRSEEHYRAVVDHANDIVSTLDLDFRFTSVNPAVERILGYAPSEVVGRPLSDFVPAEQLAMHKQKLDSKLQGKGSTQYEMQLLAKDGRNVFTLEVSSRLILEAHGTPVGIHSIARDISERKEAEQRQLILLRELQHRTKNMLAVIQSMATRTLSRSATTQEALQTFTGRLHALAHAQEFVASGPTAGLELRMLVDQVLAAFASRAIVSGAPLIVGGAFAQTFALVLHELATNASKYGALSTKNGNIHLNWRVVGSGPDGRLRFEWVERNGPHVMQPADIGLGLALIAAIGQSKYVFNPSGFEYVLEIALSETER